MAPPGPRGRSRVTQTITWIIHIMAKVTEKGSMLATTVPKPVFLSYLRAKPRMTGM